jgi:4-amino-4-deoxy-L-arabinose transferase-like glycosyltransferase
MASVTLPKDVGWVAGITRRPERTVVGLILIFTVYRLVLAATLGLGVDESYGIGVSHDLELSYFDHPPLNYWIAHFFIPLLGDGRALRLPFIVIFAGTTSLVYLFTRHLFGSVAGLWAVLTLNLSLFFTVAGSWILPDGPLMFCVVAAAYTIAHGLFPAAGPVSPWRTWLVAGLWIGLAGLSKYHAVLFVAGLFIYLVSAPPRRKILMHPAPWIGAVIALVMFSPVLIWNAEHHWVSFAYQGGRAEGSGGFPKIGQFLQNLGGQIIWLAPWVIVPMVAAAYQALRSGRAADRSWYCLCLAAPTILLFTLVPLWGDRGLPHWQMPGWLMLYPVLGDHLARESQVRRRPVIWAIASAACLILVSLLVVGHAVTGYGRVLFPAVFAKGDPTLEALQWGALRSELQRRGLLDKPGLFVISGSPIDMGKIDQALHDSMPMQVFGESKQYAFRIDPKTLLGRDALILGQRDRLIGIRRALAPYFASIEELPPFAFGRSGMDEVDVRILYGHDLQKPLPSPYDKSAD